MTPAMPAPQAEFTPYLLQQAGLRASLLQSSFGFAAEDWDDLRQDLALDCLGRLPRFDASRGDWKGFVRGVVRNQACALASRQARRPEIRSLVTADCGSAGDAPFTVEHPALAEDILPALELSLDAQRVLDGLPEELQTIAGHLAEMSFFAVSRRTGLTHAQLKRKVARIRAAFMAAGLTPRAAVIKRGGQ
jgi:RNA polymerase sigma-70 factor (ECF subfamily)